MPGVDGDLPHELGGSEPVWNASCRRKTEARPQRLNTWFNLIPVAEYEGTRPDEVLFLDSFVTIEPKAEGKRNGSNGTGRSPYRVLFEGKREMCVVVEIGVIFVWYGEDLAKPDRPFPKLYDEIYPSKYMTSRAVVFQNTHVMDFVENGSDNLHFRVVHLWEYSKMYDHEITEETITLKQDTKFRYGSCSNRRLVRLMSRVLPKLELNHDYAYHGPGLAVVGAEGSGSPRMHALVSLTPEGPDRTRVYVTVALDPTTFPEWAERPFQTLFPKHALCDLLAGIMANYIKNEFDVDAMIWKNRKYLRRPTLLPVEKHLGDVIRWGETFYPKDFSPPSEETKPPEEMRWEFLDDVENIKQGMVHPYNVAGEELIAFKGEDGNIRIFDAYCPHQGAHLGHGGMLKNDSVRCPFHGFFFDSEGRCIGPNVENRTRFISNLNLGRIRQKIEGGRVEVFV